MSTKYGPMADRVLGDPGPSQPQGDELPVHRSFASGAGLCA
jgi:hypothetical protein